MSVRVNVCCFCYVLLFGIWEKLPAAIGIRIHVKALSIVVIWFGEQQYTHKTGMPLGFVWFLLTATLIGFAWGSRLKPSCLLSSLVVLWVVRTTVAGCALDLSGDCPARGYCHYLTSFNDLWFGLMLYGLSGYSVLVHGLLAQSALRNTLKVVMGIGRRWHSFCLPLYSSATFISVDL